MISIDRVTMVNFMQYRSETHTLQTGLWALTGANRSGKSTLFEAVYWGLFGRTARNLKAVRRRGTPEGETSGVTVYGRLGSLGEFKVERTVNKSGTQRIRFRMRKDKDWRDAGTIVETQKMLEELLSTNAELFLGSVLFGHNSFRLTRARDSERKELFEEVLPLERFLSAQVLAKQEASEARNDQYANETARNMTESEIERLKGRIDEESEQFSQDRADKIVAAGKMLAESRNRLKKYQEQSGYPGGYAEVHQQVESLRPLITLDCREEEDAQALIGKLKLDVCPTCGQKLPVGDRPRLLKEQRERLRRAIERRETRQARYKSLHEVEEKFLRYESDVETLKADLEALQEMPKTNEVIAELRSQKAEKERYLKKVNRQAKVLAARFDTSNFWSEGLGRQGVVSFLLDEALEELNSYIADACQEMLSGMLIAQFNSTTELKKGSVADKTSLEVFNDGVPAEYESLSNSERERVDMAVMFGWQKFVASRTTPVDFTFFDEVFEGLDEDSLEQVFAYIQARQAAELNQRKAYIVSHVRDLKFRPEGVIRVERGPEGSRLVQPAAGG